MLAKINRLGKQQENVVIYFISQSDLIALGPVHKWFKAYLSKQGIDWIW